MVKGRPWLLCPAVGPLEEPAGHLARWITGRILGQRTDQANLFSCDVSSHWEEGSGLIGGHQVPGILGQNCLFQLGFRPVFGTESVLVVVIDSLCWEKDGCLTYLVQR